MATNELSRRAFLAGGRPAPAKMTMRAGGHGDAVSLLGFGMMRLPTVDGRHANGWDKAGFSETAIDQEMVNRQVDYALAHGVNYFDTAPVYCRGESETVLGKALARHPRKGHFIATKLSNFAEAFWPLEKSKAMFEKSLKDLQTTYVDYYLLHNIGGGSAKGDGLATFKLRFVENGVLDWLVEERRKGRIRNLGFSFHGDVRTFKWCMDNHDRYRWDFVQIQLNYVDWKHAAETNKNNQDAEKLYAALDEKGIPVVVMEPLLGGRLARFNAALSQTLTPLDPEAGLAEWAFRFAGHLPRVAVCLSGMTRMEHLEENCAAFSPLRPLSARELAALETAAQAYVKGKSIPCNECQYCMPCPYGIDIPGVLGHWNRVVARNRLPDDPRAPDFPALRTEYLRSYEKAVPPMRQAAHCVTCGRCVPHCPQSIDVPKEMMMIDAFVEDLKKGIRQ